MIKTHAIDDENHTNDLFRFAIFFPPSAVEGGKKFAELCGKWVNPAAYSHMRGSHWLMWSRHHSVFCPDGRTAKELGSSQTTTTT